MSHKVETMSYRGATPWHKLGTRVEEYESLEEVARVSGLDWDVRLVPCGALTGGPAARGHQALQRIRDGAILDIVGPRFAATQNHQALEFFRAFCDAGAATMETAGSLDGGRYVWALARMDHEWDAGRLASGQPDAMRDYLLLVLPHQQAKPLVARYTPTRVVCWNTMTAALKGDSLEYRLSHTKEFDAAARQQAQDVMGLAREASDRFADVARSLRASSVDAATVQNLLAAIILATPEERDAIIFGNVEDQPRAYKHLVESYVSAPGAEPGTRWGILNAVTHYVDHVASAKPENRAKSGLMGRGNVLKTRALELLTR